jgi:hypothetical protein
MGGTNGHCNGCSASNGVNGIDGTVTNYNWPLSIAPSIRSYIHQSYLTNIIYPLSNSSTSWGVGEDGFLIITY